MAAAPVRPFGRGDPAAMAAGTFRPIGRGNLSGPDNGPHPPCRQRKLRIVRPGPQGQVSLPPLRLLSPPRGARREPRFCLAKEKRAVHGPKRKSLCRAPAPLCLRADGGLPNWCRLDLLAICRLAPHRAVSKVSSRVSGAAVIGEVIEWPLLLFYPQGARRIRCRWTGGRRGPLQRADEGRR